MSKRINISTSHKSASEGDHIVVTWDCGTPDSVTLTIDNGYRSSRIQLADSGSRSVLIEKSKSKTTFRIVALYGSRKESAEVAVRVKNLKVIRAKEYRPGRKRSGQHRGGFSPRRWMENLRRWWREFCGRVEYGWRVMPERKKRIYRIVLIALAIMWAGSMWRNAGYRAGYEQALRDSQPQTTIVVPQNQEPLPQNSI